MPPQLDEGFWECAPVRDAARADHVECIGRVERAHQDNLAAGGQCSPELCAAPAAMHGHGDERCAFLGNGRARDRGRGGAATRQGHIAAHSAGRPRHQRGLHPAEARLSHGWKQIPEIVEAGIGRIHAGPQAQAQPIKRRSDPYRRHVADDDGGDAAGDQLLADRGCGQIRIECQQARIDLGARQRDDGPLDTIAATHGDHVVNTEAAPGESIGQQVGILVPFAIGQRRPALVQGRLVATHGGPVFETARRRFVHALSAFRTFVARLSRIRDRET